MHILSNALLFLKSLSNRFTDTETEPGTDTDMEKGEKGCPSNGYEDLSAALPEGCIANILSLTTPKDACRLSLLSSTFLSAARSDAVWERFLPSDHAAIIERSQSSSSLFAAVSSKKELYFRLCDSSLLIDDGKLSFSLERETGKKCFMLAARDLFIVWGSSPEYWKWVTLPESRFSEVTELIEVCWLEVRGKINICMLSPNTNYAAYLVFKWTEGAYGFGHHPLELSVGVVGGESKLQSVHFEPYPANRPRYHMRRRFGFHRPVARATAEVHWNRRADGWCELELGEFYNWSDEDGELLEMSLSEVKGGNWKSGLVVEGIEIRPKNGVNG